jgi:hypothetical protein
MGTRIGGGTTRAVLEGVIINEGPNEPVIVAF